MKDVMAKSSTSKKNMCVLIVESPKESMSRAFSELKKPSGKYKRMTVISFPDYETLGRVVTGARLELIAVARREKPQSIQELAKLVGRSFKSVYQDVKLLAECGLLVIHEGGPRKASIPVEKFREIVFAA
jgi:predicted transcriptional regulator